MRTKYIPRFTRGGDFGGFGHNPFWGDDWVWGGVESFYGQDVCDDLREQNARLAGYYDLNVDYEGEDYTVRYRYNEKEDDWYIAFGEKDALSLIDAMLGSGDYAPTDNEAGEKTTYCNVFVHDFYELLFDAAGSGKGMPEYASGNGWLAKHLHEKALTDYPYLSRSSSGLSGDMVSWSGHVGVYDSEARRGRGGTYGTGDAVDYHTSDFPQPLLGDYIFINIDWGDILFGN